MRMWGVRPETLCDRHLLGEHGELHKFLHNWEKKHRIDGRISGNAIEPSSYQARHDELAVELARRGMNHRSPLAQPDFSYLPPEQLNFKIDRNASFSLLVNRCPNCRSRARRTQWPEPLRPQS